VELKELIVIPNIAAKLKVPAKTGAQQERLVRIPSSEWPPHTKLPGLGASIRRVSKEWFPEGLPTRSNGQSDIGGYGSGSGARGAYSQEGFQKGNGPPPSKNNTHKG